MSAAATLSGDPGPALPEFASPPAEPMVLLRSWFAHADQAGAREPRAVTLSTANARGVPSARVVLLKDITPGGLQFGTSAESAKGRELAANPVACINVYWRELLRQVTVIGPVVALSDADSDELFDERSREARAVAVASRQSSVLDRPEALGQGVRDLLEGDMPIRRPSSWLAYRLQPTTVEFWHGSTDRLHRRLRFDRDRLEAAWSWTLLQP